MDLRRAEDILSQAREAEQVIERLQLIRALTTNNIGSRIYFQLVVAVYSLLARGRPSEFSRTLWIIACCLTTLVLDLVCMVAQKLSLIHI